jgi:pimeloyl-ACP methyl ester carboxylesterase
VAPAGLPHKMPFIAKLFCLPRVGEFFFSLNTDTIRKKNLADFFIYDKKLLTQSYFENATRYQKIKGTSETGLSILRKNFFFELSDEVKKLNEMGVPILIVWGRQDKGNPLSSGIEMSRMLENSQLEVFEQAGHVPNFEKADRFNELAISFLQQ